jgi:hypothetical protein
MTVDRVARMAGTGASAPTRIEDRVTREGGDGAITPRRTVDRPTRASFVLKA